MRYVILRDDDTNALTPVSCLERLYRPFLDRGLPVNLAVIPEVSLDTCMLDGGLEGYLFKRDGSTAATAAIGTNPELVGYVLANPGYRVAQHGCHHHLLEFDRIDAADAARRLERGMAALTGAGFEPPKTFVAPYDKLSRAGFRQVTRRYRVLSGGWYELRRLPRTWWPRYLGKKWRAAPHWRVGTTLLLSHPGCLLSCHRRLDTMLQCVLDHVDTHALSVLVTHWWEYFRTGQPNEPFIAVLHELAACLAHRPDVSVISFEDLARGGLP